MTPLRLRMPSRAPCTSKALTRSLGKQTCVGTIRRFAKLAGFSLLSILTIFSSVRTQKGPPSGYPKGGPKNARDTVAENRS